MGKLQKAFTWFEDISSAIFFIVGIGLMLYEVIMRYVFGSPTTWINEISTILVLWSVFLGLSLALRDDHHVSADIIYSLLPAAIRKWVDYFANLMGTVFCVFFVFYSIILVHNLLGSGQTSIETGVPMWLYMLVLPAAGVMFGIRFIEKLWNIHRIDYNQDSESAEVKKS